MCYLPRRNRDTPLPILYLISDTFLCTSCKSGKKEKVLENYFLFHNEPTGSNLGKYTSRSSKRKVQLLHTRYEILKNKRLVEKHWYFLYNHYRKIENNICAHNGLGSDVNLRSSESEIS